MRLKIEGRMVSGKRPRLVFVSPVPPGLPIGLGRRAANTLSALASWAEVHVLTISVHGPTTSTLDPDLSQQCASYRSLMAFALPGSRHHQELHGYGRLLPPEWLGWTPDQAKIVTEWLHHIGPDCIVCYRLYLWPWLEAWAATGGKVWMDLDESDSRSRLSLAELSRRRGANPDAIGLTVQGQVYKHLERQLLPRFSGISVSTREEHNSLLSLLNDLRITIWPNVMAAQAKLEARLPGDVLQLLFVGYLQYLPNRDALFYASEQILPLLQSTLNQPVVLNVVGSGSSDQDASWADRPGVHFRGALADISEAYRAADVVIAPLRAGTGSCIKVLEALAYRKAVVATTVAARGLNVESGRELILADSPLEFANACHQLLANRPKCQQLETTGHRFVKEEHSIETLSACTQGLLQIL